jgi:hypothetical protein
MMAESLAQSRRRCRPENRGMSNMHMMSTWHKRVDIQVSECLANIRENQSTNDNWYITVQLSVDEASCQVVEDQFEY